MRAPGSTKLKHYGVPASLAFHCSPASPSPSRVLHGHHQQLADGNSSLARLLDGILFRYASIIPPPGVFQETSL